MLIIILKVPFVTYSHFISVKELKIPAATKLLLFTSCLNSAMTAIIITIYLKLYSGTSL